MGKRVCVLGGTGFVGKHLTAKLVKSGHDVRILSHDREKHRDLLVLPTVEIFTANVHNPEVLKHYFQNQDVVINLVGILNEKRDNGSGFAYAHIELTKKVLQACRHNNIKRLLHMSAINADAVNGTSYYLRSKGEAETLVHAEKNINVTSFRPSVIFGHGDSFFNNFAKLISISPIVLPLACAQARFAPVYVGDVADAFVRSLNDPATYAKHYDLCGPDIFTLKQIVEYTAVLTGKHRYVIGLGKTLSHLMAFVFTYLVPFFKPLTLDNYRSLQMDAVCKQDGSVFPGLKLRRVHEIVPQYLGTAGYKSRYNEFRQNLHTH